MWKILPLFVSRMLCDIKDIYTLMWCVSYTKPSISQNWQSTFKTTPRVFGFPLSPLKMSDKYIIAVKYVKTVQMSQNKIVFWCKWHVSARGENQLWDLNILTLYLSCEAFTHALDLSILCPFLHISLIFINQSSVCIHIPICPCGCLQTQIALKLFHSQSNK